MTTFLTLDALIAHRLIDEYRLLIFPVFVGAGRRLFEGPALTGSLKLLERSTTDTGVVLLTYEPAGPLTHGSFALAPEPSEHRILR